MDAASERIPAWVSFWTRNRDWEVWFQINWKLWYWKDNSVWIAICPSFPYRLCKLAAITTVSQVLAWAPLRETLTALSSQGESPWISETPLSSPENSITIYSHNPAINEIAFHTPGVSREPLLFHRKDPLGLSKGLWQKEDHRKSEGRLPPYM